MNYVDVRKAIDEGDLVTADKIFNDLVRQDPNNAQLVMSYIEYLMQRNFGKGDMVRYYRGLNLCRYLVEKNPHLHGAKINLARYYIFMGCNKEALRLIDEIPDTVVNYYIIQCKAWACYQRGEYDETFKMWDFVAQQLFPQSIIDKSSSIELIKNHQKEINKHAVLHFSCCRNEIDKLPFFLEHYRSLGVDAFYIVDNESTDGSLQYLLSQKDVQVFSTKESYKNSVFGVSWINTLISHYACDHWVIHTDIDELLVYPNCEHMDLHEYTQRLDANKQNIVSGFMLDMYPESMAQTKVDPNKPLQQQHSYFMNNYLFMGTYNYPYRIVKGGLFSVLLNGKCIMLEKTPIFKANQSVKLLSSSHMVTPPVTRSNGESTCLLLHFKLVNNPIERFGLEIARNQHADNTSNYKAYNRAFSALDENFDLTSLPYTTKYENSRQLSAMGLISPL